MDLEGAPLRYRVRVRTRFRSPSSLLPGLLLAALSFACNRSQPLEPSPGSGPASTSPAPQAPSARVTLSERLSRPAPERLVAIGDLHGDLEAARRALRLAGAIDAKDHWVGGKLVVVQTGDEIDRGDDDRAILDFIERLKGEAKKAGGELIALSGNHELMNAAGDYRYVTDGGLAAFADVEPRDEAMSARIAPFGPNARHRAAAFTPGGPYATLLAERPIVVKVGDSVFVHGGVLPKHVTAGLDAMNDALRAWLLGERPKPPSNVLAEDGPVWTRAYSDHPGERECAMLDEVLRALEAKRLVMGHTVQKDGINSACGRKAWRIDVGMSRYFGGPVQVLEIKGETITVLKEGDAG